MDEKIIQYLKLLKELNQIHKEIFGIEKTIVVPSQLSEYIIREKFNLDEYDGKGKNGKVDKRFDAQKKEGDTIKYYEIKGTSSKNGTTTININNKANYLIWGYFNFNKNLIEIKLFSKFNEGIHLDYYIKKDKINEIKRNKTREKQYKGNEKFNKVFSNKKKERVTVTLDNFNFEKDITEISMIDLS